jgi:hypothetical protein
MRKRTWGNNGYRRKSAAACRKVSRRAIVVWRKRNLIRKIRSLEKCGQQKDFAATRIRMTRCAIVARLDSVMKNRQTNRDNGRIRPRIKWQGEPDYDGCSEGDN